MLNCTKKISFEIAQKLWIEYMVYHIFCKYAYPSLQPTIHPVSFEQWCAPDMFFIDGINKAELPNRYKGNEYKSSQIETFNEWLGIK